MAVPLTETSRVGRDRTPAPEIPEVIGSRRATTHLTKQDEPDGAMMSRMPSPSKSIATSCERATRCLSATMPDGSRLDAAPHPPRPSSTPGSSCMGWGQPVGGTYVGVPAALKHVVQMNELCEGTLRAVPSGIHANVLWAMVAQRMSARRARRTLDMDVVGFWPSARRLSTGRSSPTPRRGASSGTAERRPDGGRSPDRPRHLYGSATDIPSRRRPMALREPCRKSTKATTTCCSPV